MDSIAKQLASKTSVLQKRWLDKIVKTYPSDTSKFLTKEKNQFANPVGYTLRQGTESIINALFSSGDHQMVSRYLEEIIKIRSIQNFSAAQAVSFVFLLKEVIREVLNVKIDAETLQEFRKIESRIDDVALQAFDIYMKCRDKFFEIRISETKRQVATLIKRSNWVDIDINANAKINLETTTNKCQERGGDR